MEEKLTATKHEILKEFRLSDWEFDIISKKHNIRSVKNFVDERGQFIALYEKQGIAEAIKANANNKILEWEACKNNPKLITRKELAEVWKIPANQVFYELKKRNIKHFKKTTTDYGYIQYFYRKKDCGIVIEKPEKKQAVSAEESAKTDKQKELEKWLNDDRYVQTEELIEMWGVSRKGVESRLGRHKIKSAKSFNFGGKIGIKSFYDKAECDFIGNKYKGQEEKFNALLKNKAHVQARELEHLWGLSRPQVGAVIREQKIRITEKILSQRGTFFFYSRAECEAARPFIKEVKNEMEEQKLINTPLEADFIPADTLDSYTLPALVAKLKEKGATIENFKSDLFDNHADEDIKRIGMLIRGSVKSVNLWGRQVDEVMNVCGAKKEAPPVIEQHQEWVANAISDNKPIKCESLKAWTNAKIKEAILPSGCIASCVFDELAENGVYNSSRAAEYLKISKSLLHQHRYRGKCPDSFYISSPIYNGYFWTKQDLDMFSLNMVEKDHANVASFIQNGNCKDNILVADAARGARICYSKCRSWLKFLGAEIIKENNKMFVKKWAADSIFDMAQAVRRGLSPSKVAQNIKSAILQSQQGNPMEFKISEAVKTPFESRVELLEKEVSELKSFISDLKILLAKHA